jgi:hypothetical protein
MKSFAIIIASWACLANVSAQTITEKHIGFKGKSSVVLDISIADSIEIIGWDSPEVYAWASVNINDNHDNDAYSISFVEEGNTLRIKAKIKEDFYKGKENCCNSDDIRWKICIPSQTSLKTETINGNITARGLKSETIIKTISGFIDLSTPVSENADLSFSTISGTVYTNHVLGKTRTKTGIPQMIREKINNGGRTIKLETISGDIFFRRTE